MKTFTLTVLAIFFMASQALYAQGKSKKNPWQDVNKANLVVKSQMRQIVPDVYRTVGLDVSQMKSILAEAPLWETPEAKAKEVILELPMPDGSFQQFRIEESPVMHPKLQAKYPEIRCYQGYGIDTPGAYFRGDLTPKGFHGVIRLEDGNSIYIDPYSKSDNVNYIIYYQKDHKRSSDWKCGFEDSEGKFITPDVPISNEKSGGVCKKTTYLLALSCTGEYAQSIGNTICI